MNIDNNMQNTQNKLFENELTRDQYQRQWESLNASVNPKPSEEERQRRLTEYRRSQKARVRTLKMMKELNTDLIKEIIAGK
ncbi:hypothetical protein MKZ02_20135 [Pseudobacillus sp. FSL P4-0506]|uniref:hypothetical protein n=1 Tax=Pseudobacillus sp. FSL P4-0506 TaxID=2921576 RepID=UPI0030F79F22